MLTQMFCVTPLFLGAFAKLRKPTLSSPCLSACLSFYLPVHPFVRMEQLFSHWYASQEMLYLSICRKSVENIQISLTLIVLMWRIG